MPAAYTFVTLKAELQSFLENTNSRFLAALPDLIALGETKILRDAGLEIFDQVDATIPFLQSNPLVVKPAGLISTRVLRFSATAIPLRRKSHEYIADYWPDATQVSAPLFYCELTETQWLVAPTPPADSTGIARFIKRPPGLSGSVATTWLSANVPDLLLYASLACCEEWDVNDERISTWKTRYAELLDAARKEFHELIRKG